MIPFVFVTGSADKVSEVERIMQAQIEHCQLDLPEIQAVDVEQVVSYKAKYAYEELGQQRPVLIEDTGLYIEAWNGLPGALIKWFVERIGGLGICRMLQGFPNKNAWAKTVVATYDGELKIFVGEVHGRIADRPAGNEGFGWDKVFIPAGSDKTFGEMSPEEKDRYSMRRLAVEHMLAFYATNK
jgi:non-canonical purine NTP pyrophosphatase (RdgB/HAM1 family)